MRKRMKRGEEETYLAERLMKTMEAKFRSRRQLSGLGEQAVKTGLQAARTRVWQSSLTLSPVMTERSKNCPSACNVMAIILEPIRH